MMRCDQLLIPSIYAHKHAHAETCTLISGLHRDLVFLTLGRRVVVWTGNRSQRSSQERKDNGRKTDSKRTVMRAEEVTEWGYS
jgi:hypothetical protein